MKWIGSWVAWLGASLMMAGIFGVFAAGLVLQHYSQDLPSFEKLAEYEPSVVTRLYAADDRLLAEYAKENRIFMPLKAMPPKVIQAFIAAEDQNFFEHPGIDIFGIARAIKENLENVGSGHSLVGGSTITQQVVKNFLLTSEKSVERKLKEAILAYRISKVYGKDKILELYLNQIYLGRGSYGVAVASLNYFNKPLDELSTEEVALLAAMPKAPSNYDPIRHAEAARKRRNYVIERMREDGYITQMDALQAAAMPVELHQRDADDVANAEFFAEEVRRTLAEMYGASVLYEGGLTVKTTVNPEMQKHADDALRFALSEYDRRHGYRGPVKHLPTIAEWETALMEATQGLEVPLFHGQQLAVVLSLGDKAATIGLPDGSEGSIAFADMSWARKQLAYNRLGSAPTRPSDVLLVGDVIIANPKKDTQGAFTLHQIPEVSGGLVAMDPYTGRVLAMSGGYSYGKSEFNRATQARRQPGSAFKPFVYLTALENGFTPSTIVMDEPIEISQGPGKPMWRPQNYGGEFLGPITLRTGLEKSRNTLTVRLAQMLGIGRIINVAKRFGIYEGDVPRNYSMVLGAHETTLLKMVNAYAMIANGGRRIEAGLIERIDDRNGAVIYRRDTRACTGCVIDAQHYVGQNTPPVPEDNREVVLDPRVAYQLTTILQGVVERGTATSARVIGKPLAGKTGTTNDSRDTWFIGFSPDLVVGVYIGFDKPKSMGGKETGGRVALPAFINFMQEALKDTPAKPFHTPPGIQMVQVDKATGLPPYPGMPNSGLITESFIVGGNIYKPGLPQDAAQEETLPSYSQEIEQDYQEGFDPNAGWQDHYYMTPEQAQMRETQRHPQPSGGYNTTITPVAPDGYNINAGNPYAEQRREALRQRNYPAENSNVTGTGTGALY